MMTNLLVLATYLHKPVHHKNHTTEFKAAQLSGAEFQSRLKRQANINTSQSSHSHLTFLIRVFKGIPWVNVIHRMEGGKCNYATLKQSQIVKVYILGRKISLCNAFEAFGEEKGNIFSSIDKWTNASN